MIVNLGLPRTGTTSLSEAWKILGFRHGSHPITGAVWSAFHKNRKVPPNVIETVNQNWSARFVCTTRSREGWLSSVMSRFPQGSHDIFARVYDDHAQELAKMAREVDIVMLNIDEGDLCWKPICKLLNKPEPYRGFPHNSKR